jgi:PhnB protein
MLADDFAAEFKLPPLAEGRLPLVLNLYVPDADAAWAQALGAGCNVVFPIGDQFWGDRYGQVRDPFGLVWAIAQKKEELTPEELRERQANAFAGGHRNPRRWLSRLFASRARRESRAAAI